MAAAYRALACGALACGALAHRTLAHTALCCVSITVVACTLPPSAARPRSAVVEQLIPTPDGELFVRSGGSGPHLVLLHGLGDSSVGWRKVEGPLRDAGYSVTVVDALGAGRSEKPTHGDYRLTAHVGRLRHVLDALDIARATFVANSLGGSMALLLAQQDAQRVDRLVLIDPAAFPEGGATASWLWKSPLLATGALSMLSPQMIARAALQLNFGDPERISAEDVAVYTAEAARPGAIAALAAQQRQLLPAPEQIAAWTAGYRTIAVPTLILWGERDRILPRAQADRLAAALPRARLVIVRGVGHVLQLEDPQRFLREVLQFLTRGE